MHADLKEAEFAIHFAKLNPHEQIFYSFLLLCIKFNFDKQQLKMASF